MPSPPFSLGLFSVRSNGSGGREAMPSPPFSLGLLSVRSNGSGGREAMPLPSAPEYFQDDVLDRVGERRCSDKIC